MNKKEEKELENKIKKIRARTTYQDGISYLQMAEKINISVKDEEAFLLMIHSIIDEKKGYHSKTQSIYARESIVQLCQDIDSGVVKLEG